ncbi:hypothetical protein BD309DRAFT_1046627 [Dichomitus squalens]|nr:hypothetical protein BD309DRAFT_1046627 [Dichomitus squalens]
MRSSLHNSTLYGSKISDFGAGGKIKAIPHDDVFRRLGLKDLPVPKYTSTSHGIRTKLPLVPLSIALPEQLTEYDWEALPSQWYLVILGCEHDDYPGALLGQVCYIPSSESGVGYLHYGWVQISPAPRRGPSQPDLFPLSPATIARCRERIEVKTVYISKLEHATAQSEDARRQRHKSVNLVLLGRTRDALRAQGYTAELRGPDEDHRTTHWLTLSNDDHRIAVEYLHTLEDEDDGQRLWIKANVKALQLAHSSSGEVEVSPNCVEWSDWGGLQYGPWVLSLSNTKVALTLRAKLLTVQLGFDWAAPSLYSLHVEVVTKTLQDTSTTSPKLAQGAQDIEAELEGSGGGVRSVIDDARLGMLDSEGSAGGPKAGSVGEEDGARLESHNGDIDGEVEGVSA